MAMIKSNDIADQFFSLKSPQDLAKLLKVEYGRHLTYHLYRTNQEKRYQTFNIKKKTGGYRTIMAPATHIKTIQHKLLNVLTAVYVAKPSVHGFVPGRSILTNARPHIRRRYVLNVDLKDSFPSINFGRVRGLFMAAPYGLPPAVATVIAQICCHNNQLPQGAPTSPIISNMICAKMDSQLQRLAKESVCYYSRYADDLTISTRQVSFPEEIAIRKNDGEKSIARVGRKLEKILLLNGFEINHEKTRLHTRSDRQEVTGLVTNEFPNVRRTYVRNIRAMLHSWRLDGLSGAQKTFLEKHDLGNRLPSKEVPDFVSIMRGKLDFLRSIRGDANPTYRDLCRKYNDLSPKPIRLLEDPLIEKLMRAIVVFETDDNQGTAFFLKNVGLITCEHCLGKNPHIYYPKKPSQKYRVEVSKSHEDIDLAILKPSNDVKVEHELDRQNYDIGNIGHKILLAGYPAHAQGKSLSVKQGQVSGFQMKSAIKRYQLSCGVVYGASGSPVLTEDGKVVGIAVTGADYEYNVDKVSDHGAIPISAIDNLT